MFIKGQGIRSDIGATSEENQELLPILNPKWNNPRGKYYEFAFLNTESCTVIVNGKDINVLAENQGFQIGRNDVLIESVVVVESGINYQWSGKYGN
ncbi:hypothetical protein [Paenibacillus xylaniclasticus]|uniref:hypothetical protein n=1 Tax=Paenibacillus xylaniclasticus TaxID=588083 RepID=UPI000FDA20BF|nr:MULTISPECIES: hypothetical protein [Paenibacillus]GFN32601.1 hypothetical protein PCURB6_28610 [Paenibacillus curdlanolyticus]